MVTIEAVFMVGDPNIQAYINETDKFKKNVLNIRLIPS